MLALLGLFGFGILIAAFADSGDDGEADSASETSGSGGGSQENLTFTDAPDAILDESYRGGLQLGLLDLVNEGEITAAESQAFLDAVNFRTGAINVDTAGGDDTILAGSGNDTLRAGDGDDQVIGGAGNDVIDLGTGNDVSGVDTRSAAIGDDLVFFPTLAENAPLVAPDSEIDLEGGNDIIVGGPGDDLISDSYGSNTVNGQQGNDFIVTVDAEDDQGTPDVVRGGFGKDTLVVDEGDTVETGRAADRVVVDLFAGVAADYDRVTIEDFVEGEDILELEGDSALLRAAAGTAGPGPVTVEAIPDGSGALVRVGGVVVVEVLGAPGLTAADVRIST